MKRAKINWKKLERLAVKFEESGFGRVNQSGLSWHSFSPDGLKRFIIALSNNKPTRPHKKRKHNRS